MDLVTAVILGLVQGATEYLPVSSSGHLVLVPWALGFQKAPFVFDILVQLGTLVGVLVYFWRELLDVAVHVLRGLKDKDPFGTPEARFGWLVVLATFPAGVLGLLFKDVFERAFSSVESTLGFLLATAALLAIGERFGRRDRDESTLGVKDAVVIGFAQAFALFPGVSRSGSTIAAGMVLGLERPAAAKFSFVMSIPVMAGAGVIAGKDLLEAPGALSEHGLAIAVGFLVAAVSGYLVIKWFLGFLKARSLYWFVAYCALVSVVGLIATRL